ncbi:MAG: SDR family oxidoreductase [Planctomycetes bacterium]|nr:SDR family oxidoreductase [Planctomycetota bacterium]
MTTVLVTGGAGFLGSHLCERLLGAGHRVLCLDNLSTGSRANIEGLTERGRHARTDAGATPAFQFIEHDLINPIKLDAEQVYHLACPASPVHYQSNPVRTVKTNVLGTMNMLGLARRTGARILLASTSEVYGDPKVTPQREDYLGNVNQLGPRACYDEGKRIAETLMVEYHREHNIDTRIARIFNTYGPRMAFDDGRVVSNFVLNALRGDPLQLYGGGRQSRSFCYVDDMVSGLIALMNYDGALKHEPFNLGNPHELSIRELAETVLRLTGSKSAVTDSPALQDDPAHRCPDITRARTELGFRAATALEDGLKATIRDFRARM